MPVRLDVRTIDALPMDRRRDYYDEACRGLCLRLTANGRRTWCAVYSRDGRTRRYTLGRYLPDGKGMNPSAARVAAQVILGRVAAGEDPQETRVRERREAVARRLADVLTVGQLARRALAAITLRPQTRREWERVARRHIIDGSLALLPAATVARKDVRRWLRRLADAHGHTANTCLTILRRCYSWGLDRDLVEVQPCYGLKYPVVEAPSERVLSSAELWALQSALRLIERVARRSGESGRVALAHVLALRLLLLTGVRRSAVLGARRGEFESLDGVAPLWIVPADRSKSGHAQVVPLSTPAVALIRARLAEAGGGELLFESVGADDSPTPLAWRSEIVAAIVRTVRRRAGVEVPRWTVHNLRHTLATHLCEDLGYSHEIAALILGHTLRGPAVTRIYERSVRLPERRAALERWAEWLAALPRPRRA